MEPKKFKEANITFAKPGSMTDQECGSLPAYRNQHQIISCWRPSFKERLKILFAGNVWIGVRGKIQPPMWVDGNLPFYRASIMDNLKYYWAEFIEFMTAFLTSICQADKRKHYFAGAIISAVCLILCLPSWLALLAGCAAGFGKDLIWDKLLKRGCFEWFDIMWTCVGSLTICSIYWIVVAIVKLIIA